MLGNNLTEIVKEMLATTSMKNLDNLEIPSFYNQIDELKIIFKSSHS